MVKNIFATLVLCAIAGCVYAQGAGKDQNNSPPPEVKDLLKWHEVFTYEVRYSFFKLGEVKVEIVSDTLFNGEKSWYLKTVITSSGIPFVGDERNLYSSIFSAADHSFKPFTFWTDNVDEKEFNTSRYTFDYQNKKVYGYLKEDSKKDTLTLKKHGTAGHLLFYMSRLRAGTDTTVTFPIYINLKEKQITITHTTQKEAREYEAFGKPAATFYSRGHASFDGPFGFSGDFEAWYLTGDLRVPVEARVNVWLGNVKIKLIDYKKKLRNDRNLF